jgi:hypothetical protein
MIGAAMNSVRLTFSLNAELAVNLAGTPAKLSAAFQRMSGGIYCNAQPCARSAALFKKDLTAL